MVSTQRKQRSTACSAEDSAVGAGAEAKAEAEVKADAQLDAEPKATKGMVQIDVTCEVTNLRKAHLRRWGSIQSALFQQRQSATPVSLALTVAATKAAAERDNTSGAFLEKVDRDFLHNRIGFQSCQIGSEIASLTPV